MLRSRGHKNYWISQRVLPYVVCVRACRVRGLCLCVCVWCCVRACVWCCVLRACRARVVCVCVVLYCVVCVCVVLCCVCACVGCGACVWARCLGPSQIYMPLYAPSLEPLESGTPAAASYIHATICIFYALDIYEQMSK